MYSICHATLQDYLIEGSFEFMSGSSSQYVTRLKSLVTICTVIVEICFSFNA